MVEEIGRVKKPGSEDIEFVKAFQAGDKAVFDTLVLRYQDRVFRTCLRLLGNHEDANDCAQETFVKVYRSLNRFRLEAKFSTWLYTIAVNICKNWLTSAEHRRKKKMIYIDNPIETEEGSLRLEIPDTTQLPVAELAEKETSAQIQAAISSLPEDFKQIVVLRDIEGLSYEDISKVTGYNLGTVKSKLSRARQKLREKLKGLI